MNRISGKPLKTRGSGTLGVAGIPCLILGLCQGSMRAAVTCGYSGHKSDPYVAILTPAANGLTPMAVNVTPVVTVLTPPLVQCDPSEPRRIEFNMVGKNEALGAEMPSGVLFFVEKYRCYGIIGFRVHCF